MKINVSTPSTAIVVPTTEMREWLNFDSTEQDALIAGLIAGETDRAEKVTNRALMTQTVDLYLDSWPADRLCLPRPPLQSVTSISYTIKDSTASYGTVVSTSKYNVNTFGLTPYVERRADKEWPTDELETVNPIRVRFVAGSTAVSEVPDAIKTAIKLRAASGFVNREAGENAPSMDTADRLLNLYRVAFVP